MTNYRALSLLMEIDNSRSLIVVVFTLEMNFVFLNQCPKFSLTFKCHLLEVIELKY